MSNVVGKAIDRIDGRLKVCGRATFASEFPLPNMAHAVVVTSSIPKGRVTQMDVDAARRSPGVLAVLTPFNAPKLPQGGKAAVNPPAGRVLSLLQDATVAYNGQPVAVVVGETLERAVAGAELVRVSYAREEAQLDFERAKLTAIAPEKVNREQADSKRGDVPAAMARAAASMEATYTFPVEHHNPMEPHATIAVWNAPGQLTVYDATQNVSGVKDTLAKTFGLAPDKVAVINPFVGGGFGAKGSMWSHVALAAMAARSVNRPVKLVVTRPQMFAMVGNRPFTEQRMKVGANADGTLLAMQHDVVSDTSMLEDWVAGNAMATRMLYTCPNQATTHRLARMNVGTPTFMRAPGEAGGTFALESAMDEMAVKLGMDPIAFRLRNYAEQDPGSGKPFSSKSLTECYRIGAQRFNWARRQPQPGSVRNGRWLTGLGMATATYPANRSEASASATVFPDGTAIVRSGTHELGTGSYTVMTQVASDALGIPVSQIRFELGDSRLPKAPGAGGSQSVASVAPAVKQACEQLRDRIVNMALADRGSPLFGRPRAQVGIVDGQVQAVQGLAHGETVAALVARNGNQPITERAEVKPGPEKDQYSMHSFGAVFAEVWVDMDLGVVRVPRLSGVYAVGRLLNAKTAHSQLMGGLVWGAGMALLEESVRDLRNGRVVNGNLAEYHVPVNADIGVIDIAFVPEVDPYINSLGAKGIGEIGITGVAAAIANAVYNATGKRIRDLPITLDKILEAPQA